jgi:hypothetical protein
MGEMTHAYDISVGKPEEKRPFGTPRRIWEDNIRMDLRQVEWASPQYRDQWRSLANTVMNLCVL